MRTILRRVLAMIPTLLGVVVCIFVITRVLPGDPARTLAGENAADSVVAKLREQMGLDQPILVQFWDYLTGLFRGDLGYAWHTGRPVAEDFATRFPATVELGLAALLIGILVGVPLGILGATQRGRFADHATRVISLLGASMPLFWLGLIVISVFYGSLGWAPAPVGRIDDSLNPPTRVTGMYLIDSILTGDTAALQSSLAHLIWPAMVLSVGAVAIISRMTRSSMLEVLGQDYIRTAAAKGMGPARIIGGHALKNAAPSIVTIVGLELGQLLGGAVITETIFSWPGIGGYVVESINATDYAPVQAMTLLAAIIYLVVNLLVDLSQGIFDPKVRNV
ncbi:ABC transporter permease [Microbacterium sp.]|uniref:ABC transporter permease n=1 Tax=Microbacterium sp. TaxID=51671 RepID=UPI00281259F3|nr:ABC transporter permease [Microbacterium sp.]